MTSARFHHAFRILLSGAVLLLVLVDIYLALPILLTAGLEKILARQGFSQVQLELERPGLHSVRIRHLRMTYPGTNRTFVLSADRLDLQYQFSDIVHGRARRLHIPEAQLRITPIPSAQTAISKSLTLPIPAHWVRRFPLQELAVEKLDLQWQTNDSEIRHALVQGQARYVNETFVSHGSLTEDNRSGLEFTLDIAPDGRLNAALYRQDTPEQPIFKASVSVTAHTNDSVGVQGTLDARLKPLATLLASGVPKPLWPIDGRIQAQWQGDMPARITPYMSFKGVLSLDISALQLGTQLQQGNLHLQAALTGAHNSLRWHLDKDARASARLNPALLAFSDSPLSNDVRAAKPFVARAPQGLSGALHFSPAEWLLTLAAPSKLAIDHLGTIDVQIPQLIVTLLEPARLHYHFQRGQWHTDGLHLGLTAARMQPRLVAVGDIEDFSLTTHLKRGPLQHMPVMHVDAAQMSLLGGRVSGQGIDYDRASPLNSFTLEIKELDLARVVALENQQQIEASGTLDGRLPFVMTQTGMRIVDGAMHATPAGGVIRYHANESVLSMAATNPNLKLALQAFSNYHYQKLDIGVNYAENGDLALAVAAAGRNPDWNGGQPINLNINLNENIPMLLRSLRSGDDIGAQFQKRVDQRSAPKP